MVICLEQGANDLHMVQLMPFLLSRKGAKQSLRCSSPCVCLSVCLSVHSHISKTTCLDFTKFSVHVTSGRGSASSDDNEYVVYFRYVDDVKYRCRPLTN